MKMTHIFSRLVVPVLLMLNTTVSAQSADQKAAEVKQLIESKKYVFVIQSASPVSGGTIQLNTYYNLYINKDSLVSYLPYFGRAYRAEIGSTRSPLDFISTDFTYTAKRLKKGGYEINIELKDQNDAKHINLSISSSGYGTLRINSLNRQPISFYGYLTKKKQSRT